MSPRPTIVNVGRPERMSTSTHTWRGSTPSIANVATRASMLVTLRGRPLQVGHSACQFSAVGPPVAALNWHTTQPTRYGLRRSVTSVSSDLRRRLGQLGEQLAAEHLVRRGFRIMERNYRTRWGELDIVAFDGHTLAFCEVKTRRLAP